MGVSSHIYEYILPMRFLRLDSVVFCDVLHEFKFRNNKLRELDFLRKFSLAPLPPKRVQNNPQVLFFKLLQHFTIRFIWKWSKVKNEIVIWFSVQITWLWIFLLTSCNSKLSQPNNLLDSFQEFNEKDLMDLREFLYRHKDLRSKEIKANISVGYGLTCPDFPKIGWGGFRVLFLLEDVENILKYNVKKHQSKSRIKRNNFRIFLMFFVSSIAGFFNL